MSNKPQSAPTLPSTVVPVPPSPGGFAPTQLWSAAVLPNGWPEKRADAAPQAATWIVSPSGHAR